MRRRRFLQSIASSSALRKIRAAQRTTPGSDVALPNGNVKPVTMGIDHVLTELGDALACRRTPSNVEELERSKREVREALLTSLGLNPLPEKTPLNAKIAGKLQRAGYSVENVLFES